MKILILGATGLLGNTVFRFLNQNKTLSVYGTARSGSAVNCFSPELQKNIITGIDVEQYDSVIKAFNKVTPEVVINCVGLIKQQDNSKDPLLALPLNALLPHRLSALCQLQKARLIHISTDCVFSGKKGLYLESDLPDADDIYARTKCIGEVVDVPHAVTLRTSIIGHELQSHRSLLNWFLAQEGSVKGFSHAIFSGVPTVELAKIIQEYVLPNTSLTGLYHVSAKPINKCELLELFKEAYGKSTNIIPSDELVIDRSLNGDRFRKATGYVAPEWPELVRRMHEFK